MSPLRTLLGCATLALCACFVGVEDYAGRACALPEKPCAGGRVCVDGYCEPPAAPDGGALALWRQDRDGFSSVERCPQCTLTLDVSDDNALTATAPAGTTPRFAAAVAEHSVLGEVGRRGRVAGEVAVLTGPSEGELTFAALRTRTGALLARLSVLPDGSLRASTAARVLQEDAVEPPVPAKQLADGGLHEVALSWEMGARWTLTLDGEVVVSVPLADDLADPPSAQSLRLGVAEDLPLGGSSLELALRGWQLAAEP